MEFCFLATKSSLIFNCLTKKDLTHSEMSRWWSYFKYSNIDFLHLGNGKNFPNSTRIDVLTWSFMARLTKKRIIADISKPDKISNGLIF